MLSQVVELIESKRRFAITSHIRPDGDSLGSSLGLYWLLRALDKEVEVVMRDEAPHAYRKLSGADAVRVTPRVDRPYDAVFVIECSDITRPGLVDLERQFVVNIDHHSTTALFGDINWIDSTASAVGEMIYNLCKALGVRVTKEIAECVYTALITDTGSFHYSNTSERTFKVASELVRAGVKPAKVSQAVFANYPWSKIELLSEVLSTVKRDASGRVAWLVQTIEMQERASATDEDGDGFVNYPMSCGDVEACAFFKETAPNVYRVSLRSKCDVNVARIAERFGGGGHRNAAGCTFQGAWAEAESDIVGRLVDAVENRGTNGTGSLSLGGAQQEIVPAPEGRKPERDVRT
ncbi:MAG: bifunctional oligoribonuclease and phosphatase NrnA [Acidobacteriota bacterium]|jgi:phosphoesterase RecJ-like protein|nr:bifunctional oligoribonuclease and phosphatase NrnA [Acidobacteriota bacterium]MDT7806415.1 bifunctional oligoribonuclease and phosphatase NrnA [Acidobacteriota bacterium]